MLTIQEMTKHAEDFLRENYDMRLTIPITINNRLRSTLGQFAWSRTEGALGIEMNGKLVKYGADRVVLDTLRHEVIHYALWTLGIPHYDGCDEFETELRKHGVSSTGVDIEFGECVHFKCAECGRENYVGNKALLNSPGRFKTVCCNATLEVLGTKILDGTEVFA